jgi:hypothetical protein
MAVDDGMAAAAGDQPAVDREGGYQGHGQAAPEQQVGQASVHRAGETRRMALSTISITVIESVSAAKASPAAARKAIPPLSRGRRVDA